MGQVSIDLKPSRHGLPEGMPYFQATPLWEGSLFLEPEQVLYSMNPDYPARARAATYWPDGSVQWLQVSGLVGRGSCTEDTVRLDLEEIPATLESPHVRDVALNHGEVWLLDEEQDIWMHMRLEGAMAKVELPVRPSADDPDLIDTEGQYRWAAPLSALSDSKQQVRLKMNARELRAEPGQEGAGIWIVNGTGEASEVDGRLEWQLRIETIPGSPIVRLAMTWSAFWNEERWALSGASLILRPKNPFKKYGNGALESSPLEDGWFFSNAFNGERTSGGRETRDNAGADDWLVVGAETEWLGIALPDFQYLGPNRVDVAGDALEIHFWDPHSHLSLDLRRSGGGNDYDVADVDERSRPLGLSRTFDLWLIPGEEPGSVVALSTALAARDDQWLPDSATVLATGVLGPVLPEAVNPECLLLEGLRANLHFLEASREHWKWYGFVNFGDVRTNFAYGRNEDRGLFPGRWALSGRYGWRNASGDVPFGLLMAGILLDDRKLALMGLDHVRHIADVDMAHPPRYGEVHPDSGGFHRRNRDHWSGSVQMQYSPSNGLYLGYWLTGLPRLAEALEGLRSYAAREEDRSSAFAAQAWVNHYRETQQIEDLDLAEHLLDRAALWWEKATQEEAAGRRALYANNFRWASDGISTLRSFYEATGDPEYLDLMLHILEREQRGEYGAPYYRLDAESVMGYLVGAGISESLLDSHRLQQSREYIAGMIPEALPPVEEWSYDVLAAIVTETLPGAPTPAYRESNAMGKRAVHSFFALNLLQKETDNDHQH